MEKTDFKITEFHNSEFGSIRMIEDGGRLLFSGIDVAFALGYAKPRNAINVHCKGALKRGQLKWTVDAVWQPSDRKSKRIF